MHRGVLTINRVLFSLLAIALLGLMACNPKTVYDEGEDIDQEVWVETDTLVARFEITDSTHYHNIFVNARFSALYPFSNIYFKAVLIGPQMQQMKTVKNFAITDKSGKWLGQGFGDLHSYSFPLYEDMELKKLGTYRLKVIPYMRKPELKGIHDRGVKVTIGKEIF